MMGILEAIRRGENLEVYFVPAEAFTEGAGGGCTIYGLGKGYPIFIDKSLGKWEKRLVAAHEFAHVLFGHARPDNTITSDQMEQEARIFAGAFTALMMFHEYNKPEGGGVDG